MIEINQPRSTLAKPRVAQPLRWARVSTAEARARFALGDKMMRHLAIVSMVLLSGCVMDWSRPGTSAEQMRQDYGACDIAATGTYPENMVHIGSDRLRDPSKDVDTNATLRDQEAQYCMRQKGYACHLKCTR